MPGDKETLEVFIKGLRDFMHRKGWTQARLASELGFKAQGSVSAVVNGASQLNYCQLVRLLELGMSLNEMFGKELVKADKMADPELAKEVMSEAMVLFIRKLLNQNQKAGGEGK